ncbi:hypothetical protein GCM10010420_02650 [Streptomyces glaucosporus]|uniref:Integral membrane protein n=1 Tax=Streptomyces glaucosporus TaxID=284044 RepID=A0ABP5UPM3_9ACTN
MAHAIRRRTGGRIAAVLNSDHQAHPVENRLVAVTAVLALVAFVTGFFPVLHLLASWAGLAGVVAGLWGQMISATTEERFVLVIGTGAAALGFFLGMWNGGLY